MRIDFTPLFRPRFLKIARRVDNWKGHTEDIQKRVLTKLLSKGAHTEYGVKYDFEKVTSNRDIYEDYKSSVPLVTYEDIRDLVMRMINGEKDVLWSGRCQDFAQSSGTSGGKSKFIPITKASLQGNHYRGGEDAVAHYLRNNPKSKIFSGKGFILGGSFANTLGIDNGKVHIGDLSATLINRITPLAELVRVPDRKTALMPDWDKKLPALVEKASKEYVTNISGVPSWFLTVLRRILEKNKVTQIEDVWPGLEVFFHGGISFEPYKEEYQRITSGLNMHFVETYNASEGFFAVQNDPGDNSMLLIIDRDVFYEFIPIDDPSAEPLPAWEVTPDKVYELVISSSNGLWRYRLGDTVRVTSVDPVKIRIVGRTGAFINAFGEELMDDNAEKGIAKASKETGAFIRNFTAAPVYPQNGRKGRHQWLIEWDRQPENIDKFALCLDKALREVNSDYDAKRNGDIFLDVPEIITAREGLFDDWLRSQGSHKLGGQRKVPRLANDRTLMDILIKMNQE